MDQIDKAALFAVAFGLSLFGLVSGLLNAPSSCPSCELECPGIPDCKLTCPEEPDCLCYAQTCPEPPQFMKIIRDMAAEHEYDYDYYNCDEYSRQLKARLDDAGYESYYCLGNGKWITEGSDWHAWVKSCVYIESVTGEILTPDRFRENYNLAYCNKEI